MWGKLGAHKVHLLSWERVFQPKKNGGLGLRDAKSYNEALLMKLSWEVYCNSNTLWVNVLRNKYKMNGQLLGSLTWKKKGSSLWRAMYDQFNIMEKAMAWALGNGRRVKFWLDNWVGFGGNLLGTIIDYIPPNERFKSVRDYVKEDGEWDWDRFAGWLPSLMLLKIASIKPLSEYIGEDMKYWGCSKSG